MILSLQKMTTSMRDEEFGSVIQNLVIRWTQPCISSLKSNKKGYGQVLD